MGRTWRMAVISSRDQGSQGRSRTNSAGSWVCNVTQAELGIDQDKRGVSLHQQAVACEMPSDTRLRPVIHQLPAEGTSRMQFRQCTRTGCLLAAKRQHSNERASLCVVGPTHVGATAARRAGARPAACFRRLGCRGLDERRIGQPFSRLGRVVRQGCARPSVHVPKRHTERGRPSTSSGYYRAPASTARSIAGTLVDKDPERRAAAVRRAGAWRGTTRPRRAASRRASGTHAAAPTTSATRGRACGRARGC